MDTDTLRLVAALKFGGIDWRIQSSNPATPVECVPSFEHGIARLMARSNYPYAVEIAIVSVTGK